MPRRIVTMPLNRAICATLKDDCWELRLPLCPSTNERLIPVRIRGRQRLILSREARGYIRVIGDRLRRWAKYAAFQPLARKFTLPMWVITRSPHADGHNYDKVLFDTLERGGIVTNDRFILPHLRDVTCNRRHPEIVIQLPCRGAR